METDYFKVPRNKHLGKKPKDWQVFKYSKEKIWNQQLNGRQESRRNLVYIL